MRFATNKTWYNETADLFVAKAKGGGFYLHHGGTIVMCINQGFEILRPLQNPGILRFFHKFLMKYSDLAPESGQNDTQLAMFSTKFDRV